MEENWKYQTYNKVMVDGYYLKEGIAIINLNKDKHKSLELNYELPNPKSFEFYNEIVVRNEKDIIKKPISLSSTEFIIINDVINANDEVLSKLISDVYIRVMQLTGKWHELYTGASYIRYVADIMRTNRVLICKFRKLNK